MTPLTPERIKQIQVEVLMKVMMGGIENCVTDEGMQPSYAEETPTCSDWAETITNPLRLCGLLQAGGGYWAVSKDGEEFVKNYYAANE